MPEETQQPRLAQLRQSMGQAAAWINPLRQDVGISIRTFLTLGKWILGLVIMLFVALGVLTLTSLDLTIMKPFIQGYVYDTSNKPIAGAVVSSEGKTATTNSAGYYYLGNLELRNYEVTVEAKDYEDTTVNVDVQRTFLNYANNVNFNLVVAGKATISGKLVVADADYQFLDDSVKVGDLSFKPKTDGTFTLLDVPTGTIEMEVISDNYVNSTASFRLAAGVNPPLKDIELEPAADIIGSLKSFVRGTIVSDLKIEVTEVPAVQIVTTETGEFRIQDLEPEREYQVRISHPQYLTREYSLTVGQGVNTVPEMRIVERGTVAFLRETDQNSTPHLFRSEFDGQNAVQLTSDRSSTINNIYVSTEGIYYFTTRDSVTSRLGGRAGIPYLSTGAESNQRLLTTSTGIGILRPNYAAGLMTNYTITNQSQKILEIMGINGSNRRTVLTTTDNVENALITDNSKIVYYYLKDGVNSGLYRVDTANIQPQKSFDKPGFGLVAVNRTGDQVLYTTVNAETGLTELWQYTQPSDQHKLIKSNVDNTDQYQFVTGSDNLVLYRAVREGGENIYLLQLRENSEQSLTKFSGSEGVRNVYQQAGWIVYETNRGLYIMDVQSPKLDVKITDNFALSD